MLRDSFPQLGILFDLYFLVRVDLVVAAQIHIALEQGLDVWVKSLPVGIVEVVSGDEFSLLSHAKATQSSLLAALMRISFYNSEILRILVVLHDEPTQKLEPIKSPYST